METSSGSEREPCVWCVSSSAAENHHNATDHNSSRKQLHDLMAQQPRLVPAGRLEQEVPAEQLLTPDLLVWAWSTLRVRLEEWCPCAQCQCFPYSLTSLFIYIYVYTHTFNCTFLLCILSIVKWQTETFFSVFMSKFKQHKQFNTLTSRNILKLWH